MRSSEWLVGAALALGVAGQAGASAFAYTESYYTDFSYRPAILTIREYVQYNDDGTNDVIHIDTGPIEGYWDDPYISFGFFTTGSFSEQVNLRFTLPSDGILNEASGLTDGLYVVADGYTVYSPGFIQLDAEGQVSDWSLWGATYGESDYFQSDMTGDVFGSEFDGYGWSRSMKPGLWTRTQSTFCYWADEAGNYLDNTECRVSPAPAPIPLPASALLLLVSLAGLALARHQKVPGQVV